MISIMAITSPKRHSWVLDDAADVHVCNDRNKFMHYIEDPTTLTGVTSKGFSLGRGTVKLTLAREDSSQGPDLTLHDVLCISQSPANLISQGRLMDAGLYHDSETWEIYDKDTRGVVGYAPRWKHNWIVKLYNQSDDSAVQITQIDDDTF